MKPSLASTFALLLLWCLPAYATTPSVSADLKELVQLRAQVDTLSHELTQTRAQEQDQQRATATQVSHLELQIRQEQLRYAMLRTRQKQSLESVQNQHAKREQLYTPLQKVITVLRSHVATTLPYQQSSRLRALEKLEKEIVQAQKSPATTLAKILQFIEDERTLTREVGLGQQVINLGNRDVLVNVAHVGMAALYFSTSDKRYGWATKNEDTYTFNLFVSPEQSQAARAIFETLESNQRTGLMELPLLYTENQGDQL